MTAKFALEMKASHHAYLTVRGPMAQRDGSSRFMAPLKGVSMSKFQPGTRVRCKGSFLRSTGQASGSEGLSRWTVVACDCGLCGDHGRFIAVDQPSVYDPSQLRHFAVANMEAVRS